MTLKNKRISKIKVVALEWSILITTFPLWASLILSISFLCYVCQGRPVFYSSTRVGKDKKTFQMLKFRSMQKGAPLSESNQKMGAYVTDLGRVLRLASLDELPQIINIVLGDMSLVGPRPCLPSQTDLIIMRETNAIFSMKPGITGLAQVKGRDFLSNKHKVKFERFYLEKQSVALHLHVIIVSMWVVASKVNIRH